MLLLKEDEMPLEDPPVGPTVVEMDNVEMEKL